MVRHKKSRSIFLSTMAGSLAISSPLAFTLPVEAVSKDDFSELKDLSYGEHHDAVIHLQEKLKTLNYFQGEYSTKYDVLTEHAVKSFQKDHELNSSGAVDENTVLKLEEEIEKHYLETIKEYAEELHFGEQNNQVKQIQKALHYFGFYHDSIDAKAGPATRKALERMNKAYDLSLDLTNYNQIVQVAQKESKPKIEQTVIKSSDESTPQSNSVIQTARSYMGSPYVWGGESPSGFDCSGFLQFVFSKHGKSVPRTVDGIWYSSKPVDQPSIGDLVFFETYKPGPSHAGIYLGDGQFIHAGVSNGVTISNVNDTYWQSRYLGSRRVVQ
ncbi:C40 family peptidase [Tenuibacillus multivorans]|uniref:Putative peptidoglycan binding domain-containing protein n=1 Tax=Tenuibacillus multivorans TaxID=237069 RepID=A0A1H0CQS3_9BACI|nr:NlpC/P60 family protein [Tenuibacillus multivorans]GEL76202.1 hypothetical protein TMU01_04370 [Tenuibacillus multivorans]SDN60185.1 Putative peptidoglycan binding domain-containing protein [Tenuibacillus multivorans]